MTCLLVNLFFKAITVIKKNACFFHMIIVLYMHNAWYTFSAHFAFEIISLKLSEVCSINIISSLLLIEFIYKCIYVCIFMLCIGVTRKLKFIRTPKASPSRLGGGVGGPPPRKKRFSGWLENDFKPLFWKENRFLSRVRQVFYKECSCLSFLHYALA